MTPTASTRTATTQRSVTTLLVAVVVLGVTLGFLVPTTAAQSTPHPSTGENDTATPSIVSALPNPAADGDEGEYVVVTAGQGNVTLSDGEDRVIVPPDGRVVLASSPEEVPSRVVGRRVAASLSLSNAGERLVLRRDGRRVDTLRYENAPTAERVVATPGGPAWRPVGFTPREASHHGPTSVRGFVLPDSPEAPVAPIRRAEERVLLAGYTFGSRRVAEALVDAERRGVTVRVLLDGSPVGGTTARQASLLDRLVAAGVDVRLVDGERAPVAYHHPKYTVADDAAVVLTENWKPAGTGGRSSRGWGMVVRSPAVAEDLASLFAADASGPGTTTWTSARRGETFEPPSPANGSYPTTVDPVTFRVDAVTVLTAPGNAREAVERRIADAETRVVVVQPTIGRDSSLLDATLAAAERGVRVRILLSNEWYVAEDNRALADALNERAGERDLPLAVRVADPRGRYEKIHAKGVVVDDTAVVGSLNWNRHAATENREVVLALEGHDAAEYYAAVFDRDWSASGDGHGQAPRLFLLCVAILVGVAGVALRRRF